MENKEYILTKLVNIREDIDSKLEDSREKSITLTKVDEAILWVKEIN